MTCTSPVVLFDKEKRLSHSYPCGRCMACRIQKVKEWTVRLTHEISYHKDNCFITLTYADEFLPLTNCGKSYLKYEDFQLFMKRLRKKLLSSIKFFACGEYGENFGRPHFHAILFGLPPDDNLIRSCWQLGITETSAVIPERIDYCCGYIKDKLNGSYKRAFRPCIPEPFCHCSRGLGLQFVEDNLSNIEHSGLYFRGHEVNLPRYYIKKKPENLGVFIRNKRLDDDALLLMARSEGGNFREGSDLQKELVEIRETRRKNSLCDYDDYLRAQQRDKELKDKISRFKNKKL